VLEEAVLSEALLFCPFPEPPLQLTSAVIANTESVSFSDFIKNLYLVFYGTKIRNFFKTTQRNPFFFSYDKNKKSSF
jgi:hypothetical protein